MGNKAKVPILLVTWRNVWLTPQWPFNTRARRASSSAQPSLCLRPTDPGTGLSRFPGSSEGTGRHKREKTKLTGMCLFLDGKGLCFKLFFIWYYCHMQISQQTWPLNLKDRKDQKWTKYQEARLNPPPLQPDSALQRYNWLTPIQGNIPGRQTCPGKKHELTFWSQLRVQVFSLSSL